MKTALKNFWSVIVLSFQLIVLLLDKLTIKRLVELLKIDKLYMFIRDASLLDLICILSVLFCVYVFWKLLCFTIYVFQ